MAVNSILIFGPPASGKNTVGRLLVERIKDAKYLQNHSIIDLITPLFPFGSIQAKELAFNFREQLLSTWVDFGNGTLVTTQVLGKSSAEYVRMYQEYSKLIHQKMERVLIIALNAKQDTLISRSSEPNRMKFRKVNPQDVRTFINESFHEFDIEYEDIFPDAEILRIDTDEHSPQDSMNLILNRLDEMDQSDLTQKVMIA